jgi:hypothetical protein
MSRITQAAVAQLGWDDLAPAARYCGLDVADFPRSEYSLKDVKRAGEMIAGTHPLSPEILQAFQVANNWRQSHAYPMRSIRHQLISYMHVRGIHGVTGARLKRMQAIRRKLNRMGLHLNQLQDLGG